MHVLNLMDIPMRNCMHAYMYILSFVVSQLYSLLCIQDSNTMPTDPASIPANEVNPVVNNSTIYAPTENSNTLHSEYFEIERVLATEKRVYNNINSTIYILFSILS